MGSRGWFSFFSEPTTRRLALESPCATVMLIKLSCFVGIVMVFHMISQRLSQVRTVGPEPKPVQSFVSRSTWSYFENLNWFTKMKMRRNTEVNISSGNVNYFTVHTWCFLANKSPRGRAVWVNPFHGMEALKPAEMSGILHWFQGGFFALDVKREMTHTPARPHSGPVIHCSLSRSPRCKADI